MLRAICDDDTLRRERSVDRCRRFRSTRRGSTRRVVSLKYRPLRDVAPETPREAYVALVKKTTKPLGWYYQNSMVYYGDVSIPAMLLGW